MQHTLSPPTCCSWCQLIAIILFAGSPYHSRLPASPRSSKTRGVARYTVPLRAGIPIDPVSRLGASEGASFGMMGRESDFELPPLGDPCACGRVVSMSCQCHGKACSAAQGGWDDAGDGSAMSMSLCSARFILRRISTVSLKARSDPARQDTGRSAGMTTGSACVCTASFPTYRLPYIDYASLFTLCLLHACRDKKSG
ncbi:hypothetical protein C8R45DRAFT_523804 [Mycena sanguinolenta]|nr:hypothetical protein C8R45DRAFT_523804 [Mycena sanguinolenta]